MLTALKQASVCPSDAMRAYGKLSVTLRQAMLLVSYRQWRYVQLVGAYLLKRYDEVVGKPGR